MRWSQFLLHHFFTAELLWARFPRIVSGTKQMSTQHSGCRRRSQMAVAVQSVVFAGCLLAAVAHRSRQPRRLADGLYFIPTIVQLRWSSFFAKVERLF
uniref:Uncharacterized protein n=1 Tax=Ixodes ricinus TaxID=34613 RepID=A0A6B0UFC4_IXORI